METKDDIWMNMNIVISIFDHKLFLHFPCDSYYFYYKQWILQIIYFAGIQYLWFKQTVSIKYMRKKCFNVFVHI